MEVIWFNDLGIRLGGMPSFGSQSAELLEKRYVIGIRTDNLLR